MPFISVKNYLTLESNHPCMYVIENDFLAVSVQRTGAELSSIYHKSLYLEYLWSGDPAFWAKKSPVLFPIVGALKENSYEFEGKTYELGRHGFARELDFGIKELSPHEVVLTLTSDERTLAKFPFSFTFDIQYTLNQDCLSVTYHVQNTGKPFMYFSVGGHPAFKVPLAAGTNYEDYYLEFAETENAGRWPIAKDGLIESSPIPLLENTKTLPLSKDLFSRDALVFKNFSSTGVSLKSNKTSHGFEFNFSGFPYLGIWAAGGADFVCIEPWCGIADSVNSNRQLANKEGINKLGAGEIFSRTWTVKFY